MAVRWKAAGIGASRVACGPLVPSCQGGKSGGESSRKDRMWGSSVATAFAAHWAMYKTAQFTTDLALQVHRISMAADRIRVQTDPQPTCQQGPSFQWGNDGKRRCM